MIIDEEVYLEHFGVKGMKWGVYNKRRIQKRTVRRENRAKPYDKQAASIQGKIEKLNLKTPKTDRGRAGQAERRKNLVRNKELATKNARLKRKGKLTSKEKETIAKVGIFVAFLLANSKASSGGETGPGPNRNNYSRPSASVSDLINKERNVKTDAINRTFSEGFIDETQRKQFVDAMNKRYDRKLVDALK